MILWDSWCGRFGQHMSYDGCVGSKQDWTDTSLNAYVMIRCVRGECAWTTDVRPLTQPHPDNTCWSSAIWIVRAERLGLTSLSLTHTRIHTTRLRSGNKTHHFLECGNRLELGERVSHGTSQGYSWSLHRDHNISSTPPPAEESVKLLLQMCFPAEMGKKPRAPQMDE